MKKKFVLRVVLGLALVLLVGISGTKMGWSAVWSDKVPILEKVTFWIPMFLLFVWGCSAWILSLIKLAKEPITGTSGSFSDRKWPRTGDKQGGLEYSGSSGWRPRRRY